MGFYYTQDYIIWTSFLGNYNDHIVGRDNHILFINQWYFTKNDGYIFTPGNAVPHINLWLANNTHILDSEVIVSNFIYCPNNWVHNTKGCLYTS